MRKNRKKGLRSLENQENGRNLIIFLNILFANKNNCASDFDLIQTILSPESTDCYVTALFFPFICTVMCALYVSCFIGDEFKYI